MVTLYVVLTIYSIFTLDKTKNLRSTDSDDMNCIPYSLLSIVFQIGMVSVGCDYLFCVLIRNQAHLAASFEHIQSDMLTLFDTSTVSSNVPVVFLQAVWRTLAVPAALRARTGATG